MELYDVVTRLIGPVNPIGETREDKKRLENLKILTGLVEELFSDIEQVALFRHRVEWSMKTAGKAAKEFMDRVKDDLAS